jgi:predicted enzyme related to lactoylglutathione lyase
MISGVHAIVFSPAAEEVRAFFWDTLGLRFVDAGDDWLIFGLPPAEPAVHPADAPRHEIYLLCDDLDATVTALEMKGVALAQPITDQSWGRLTAIALPDGSEIGLYQSTHPRPGTR